MPGQSVYLLPTYARAGGKEAGSSTTETESWMDGCDWGKHDHAPAPTPAPTPLTFAAYACPCIEEDDLPFSSQSVIRGNILC